MNNLPLDSVVLRSRKERRQQAKTRRKRRARTATIAVLLSFATLVSATVLVGFVTPWGNRMRLLAAETIISTRHYYLAQYLTTHAEYQALARQLNTPVIGTGVSANVHVTAKPVALPPKPVDIKPVSGPGYNGFVMLVHNPRLIRLVSANVHQGMGEYITDIGSRVGAVAGANASGFADPKGEGWGGIPVGLELVGGQTVNPPQSSGTWATVGFTKTGIMVMGQYSLTQLAAMGVRDAMQFHPELVVDGKPMITYGDGGWGYGPRTAIGQTKDGTVIFVIINGRFHNSGMGASQRQVMDLMLQYGALNACAMDGGSSSVLYNDGRIVNSPSTIDPNGQRHLPDAWMVFPSEAASNAYGS